MSTKTSSTSFAGAGVLAAIAASLCCILPVLALIAGASGIASSFSWLEPARPYFIGVTVLVLGFAWYQKLRPKPADECGCETAEKKPPFLQSKSFLALVTVFAAATIAFPLYSYVFFPKPVSKIVVVDSGNIEQVRLNIAGMNCAACNEEVTHAAMQTPGVLSATADFETGTASVRFDRSKASIQSVIAAINQTGYTVTNYQLTSDVKQQ